MMCPITENRMYKYNLETGRADFRRQFVVTCPNEPRNLEAEFLSTVCNDVETEPVISGETVE